MGRLVGSLQSYLHFRATCSRIVVLFVTPDCDLLMKPLETFSQIMVSGRAPIISRGRVSGTPKGYERVGPFRISVTLFFYIAAYHFFPPLRSSRILIRKLYIYEEKSHDQPDLYLVEPFSAECTDSVHSQLWITYERAAVGLLSCPADSFHCTDIGCPRCMPIFLAALPYRTFLWKPTATIEEIRSGGVCEKV